MNRGEIWSVQFDPTVGDEIQKLRPAVIVNIAGAFRHQLQIVVPITTWQPRFQSEFWMIRLPADTTTGLKNESVANAFQVKSLSSQRFMTHIGQVTQPCWMFRRVPVSIYKRRLAICSRPWMR